MVLQHYGSQWCRQMSKMLFTIFMLQVSLIGTPILADEKPPHGIESVLYDIYRDWNTDDHPRAKRPVEQYRVQMVGDDRIVVILEPMSESDNSYGLTDKIDRQGLREVQAEILAESRSFMRVSIPVTNLVALSKVSGVNLVRKPMRPILNAVGSEGSLVMQTARFHNAGHWGEGVKIAILDGGYDKFQEAQANGDLPANFSVTGYSPNSERHGTGCAEIIYDIVPEALLLPFQYDDFLEFENAVDTAIQNDIDIISYSGGWVDGWGDGKGRSCEIVKRAYQNGILWVNGIGNEAKNFYRGRFQSTDGDRDHDFGGEYDAIQIKNVSVGDEIRIALVWDDFPRTSEDYDMYLWKSVLGINARVDRSITTQRNSKPFESIEYTVTDAGLFTSYHIQIVKSASAQPMDFKIISLNHNLSEEFVTPRGSLINPSDSEYAVSVGAIKSSRYIYGPQEDYSSQGPTMDGRIKPDIMGPTGVKTYAYGSQGFHGTSAAAPHVAGAAALILSANPELTVSELRNKLFEATVDMGSPGKDNIYGYGRLDLSQIGITLSVFHAGDFDGDLDVDILDLLAFSEVYGLTSADPNYDARMDMDNNGVIDVLDLLLFSEVYGKTY